MNILYVSKIGNDKAAGLSYSIPRQVSAQAKFDQVLWINLSDVDVIDDGGGFCVKRSVYPGELPDCLPHPFCDPDLVVFEGLYNYPFEPLALTVMKRKIPYIIIPRGSMTAQAIKQRRLKKEIAGVLFFNRFIKKATAIHYLTQAEQRDSSRFPCRSVVLPNGCILPERIDYCPHEGKTVITYIGRLHTYHKGMDLLLEACDMIQNELRQRNVVIQCYGPDREGALAYMRDYCNSHGLDDLVQIGDGLYSAEKIKALKDSDLFIMTSRFEGMPMGLIEALAYGLPCIVTPGTNLQREILDADAGFGCDPEPRSIADAILDAVSDRERLKRLSRNAVTLAKAYSWESIAQRTHVVYEELIR